MRNKFEDNIKNYNNLRQLSAHLGSDLSKVDKLFAPQIELLNDIMKHLNTVSLKPTYTWPEYQEPLKLF